MKAEIKTNKGIINLELFKDKVPLTVANFAKHLAHLCKFNLFLLISGRQPPPCDYEMAFHNYMIPLPHGTPRENTGFPQPHPLQL